MIETVRNSRWKDLKNSEMGDWIRLLLVLGIAMIIPFLPAFAIRYFGLFQDNQFILYAIKLATYLAFGVITGIGIAIIISVIWWSVDALRKNHS